MRLSRAELESHRGGTVDDVVGPGLKLLFVGINPGLWTAAVNAPFAYPGNRFYPALYRVGIIEHPIDASAGLNGSDLRHLIARGVGITNFVNRATARADELSADELRTGAATVTAFIVAQRPEVVAVTGITAYRVAFRLPHAKAGLQPESLAGAQLWVVPNPSGLNAHETIDSLAAAYAEPARAAGLLPSPRVGGGARPD